MRDLGTLGGSTSQALAINEAGDVAGGATDTFEAEHAVIWSRDGKIHDLGLAFGGVSAEARAINNRGDAAGLLRGAVGNAILWRPGRASLLLAGLGVGANARGINDFNQVIGIAQIDGGNTPAPFRWTASTGMQNLGSLGGISGQARGINDRGVIVGESSTMDGEIHAFTWTEKSGMVDLGIPPDGDVYSGARAINDLGWIGGSTDTPDGLRYVPVIWLPVAR